MRRCLSFLTACAAATLLVSACSTAPERSLSREPARYASLPNGHDPLDPERLASGDTALRATVEEGIIPRLERKRGRALQILLLSGGGQYGAFGAGFLNGWTERGDRPQFDIVTGVSAGALLATHAFLGTPADDVVLKEIFTGVDDDSIYRRNTVIGLLFGGNAIYDTSPLQGLLDRYMTDETMRRVAAAYDDGRRLIVGTTNLDYGQTWVWDLTLIAKNGELELYKKVLRASASPPVAFPPVEIDGHLFGDGGVRQNIVVMGLAGKRRPPPPMHGAGTIYLVRNGKSDAPPSAVRNDVVGLAATSIGAMLENSMDSLMIRAYISARAHGYRFRTVAIPVDADIGNNALAFDPEQMRTSFDAGKRLGIQQNPWRKEPPFLEDVPRWALDLVTPGR